MPVMPHDLLLYSWGQLVFLSPLTVSADHTQNSFPDPYLKKSHHKRRVVQPGLIDTIARVGADLILMTDVEDVWDEALHVVAASAGGGGGFRAPVHLSRSPFPVPTQREKACEAVCRPIWRTLWHPVNRGRGRGGSGSGSGGRNNGGGGGGDSGESG